MTPTENPRIASADVDPLFINRWSPRSFSDAKLTGAEIASIFEGARWSPSSFNRQPWLFVYETDGPDRETFDSILMPGNQLWASKAPLIGFIFAETKTQEGRRPRTSQFDTGAAWMALALQARSLGIYTHGMAGIDYDSVHEKLGVSDEYYTAMCGFVAGRIGPREALPEDLRERESPNDRKPVSEIAHKGVMTTG
ncbi:MAG: nitroreductase family protein [Chloroflexi bacterium]|nr:nitroreductase family protein [Chloroflexota bacterium]